MPYQRPPLSKAFLKGECEAVRVVFAATSGVRESKHRFAAEPARRAHRSRSEEAGVRRWSRSDLFEARVDHGRPCPSHDHQPAAQAERAKNFHYLRTIDDVLAIRSRFEAGQRLVVIGGGYIGLEVAASAIARDLNVTVLEALPRVLARVTAPQMSAFYEQVHRDAGVDLRTNVEVTGLGLQCRRRCDHRRALHGWRADSRPTW